MLRLGLLSLFVIALCVFALRNWFLALCGLVVLTVFTQHPSMPTNILGIQGLNPWNFVLAVIVICWLVQRKRRIVNTPIPPRGLFLLIVFAFMTVASGAVAVLHAESFRGSASARYGYASTLVDSIVNPLKFLLLGVMFYDGTTGKKEAMQGIAAAVAGGICYAFLLFKSMGERVFTIDYEDARRLTDKLVGLFANDLAELFAFTIWAGLVFTLAIRTRGARLAFLALVVGIIPPFLALKSRAGFFAACCVGLALGCIRWRWILVAVPFAVGVIAIASPSVRERVLMGVDAESTEESWDEISAGRVTNIWPPTLKQIANSPILGHGRYAILREDCYNEILERERNVPNHPHSAYLEVLVDAGIVGLAIVLACMAALLRVAIGLMRRNQAKYLVIAGGVAVCGVVSAMTAGITGSTFFPRQSSVPYLCVWAIAVRLWTARMQSTHSAPLFARGAARRLRREVEIR